MPNGTGSNWVMTMAVVLRTGRRRVKLKRSSKYRNKKVVADGIRFDSEKEWLRYMELELALKSCLIAKLEVHPRFDILVNGEKICTYVGDFAYLAPDRSKPLDRAIAIDIDKDLMLVVEDTKAFDRKEKKFRTTEVYKIKKKLMKAVHGIEVQEI